MPDPLFALSVGLLFVGVSLLLIWPDKGLAARWRRLRRMSARILREDALKHLHKCEANGQPSTLPSIAGALQINPNRTAALLAEMAQRAMVTLEGDTWKLTPAGRDSALHVIRAHRLWERHLAEDTGFSESEWHPQAERVEHRLSPAEADALSARLGHPTHDPHGDPIPTAEGALVAHGGRPLATLALDTRARIVHIEDEPEAVYAQLVAEGLYPGMSVRLTEVSPQRVRFWANGDEHVLAPIVAANVSVAPIVQEVFEEGVCEPLAALKPGEQATVAHLSPRCHGPERRRMMDLGILPGTVIEAELTSPTGDPTAYRIRGATIALRREQARWIHITRQQEAAQ